jgi:hypothetical protein
MDHFLFHIVRGGKGAQNLLAIQFAKPLAQPVHRDSDRTLAASKLHRQGRVVDASALGGECPQRRTYRYSGCQYARQRLSSASKDSVEACCWAASTTDQRVFGNKRGPALDELKDSIRQNYRR